MISYEGENKNKRGLVENGSDEIFSMDGAVLLIGSACERIQEHPRERCPAPSCAHRSCLARPPPPCCAGPAAAPVHRGKRWVQEVSFGWGTE